MRLFGQPLRRDKLHLRNVVVEHLYLDHVAGPLQRACLFRASWISAFDLRDARSSDPPPAGASTARQITIMFGANRRAGMINSLGHVDRADRGEASPRMLARK